LLIILCCAMRRSTKKRKRVKDTGVYDSYSGDVGRSAVEK
jgi:hypothetical protein